MRQLRRNGIRLLLTAALACFATIPIAVSAVTPLKLQKIDSGYVQPLYLTHAPGDPSRLFVVEKGGQIWTIKNGSRLAAPFLDVRDRMFETPEGGLLSLAFDPAYQTSGRMFVSYTGRDSGEVVVSRFLISTNPDSVDMASEDTLMQIPHYSGRHVSGSLAISPTDGYLYISIGDGGAGDPDNRAQNLDSLLGKILRIDVSGSTGYVIPPDNPFVGSIPGRDEIWAYGLRNMWRFSFDRQTGDFFGADVGHLEIEEINFHPSGAPGGANYGWKLKEGLVCNEPPVNCDSGVSLTDPILQYLHNGDHCAVNGGYVYRGCAIPSLQGSYFYGDLCSGQVWSLRWNGSVVSDLIAWGDSLRHDPFALVSFGEDANGELYTVQYTGEVFKIVPDGVPSLPCGPCCIGKTGDVNYTGNTDIADIVYLVDYLFIDGTAPPCLEEANTDGLGEIDIADLMTLVWVLFISQEIFLANCP